MTLCKNLEYCKVLYTILYSKFQSNDIKMQEDVFDVLEKKNKSAIKY